MYPKTKLNPVYKLIKATKEAGYTPDPNSLQRKIVSNLPSTGIEDNCIYMVYDSKDGKKGNTYNEYMYTEGKWELLGPTKTNGGGGDVSTLLIEVEYDDLVDLRDNKQLIPGCLYRITDYVTKGGDGEYFGSHEHPFDIIVLALSTDTLSEDAMAIQHEGETKDSIKIKMFIDGTFEEELIDIFDGTKQTIDGVEYFVAEAKDGQSPNVYSTTTKPASPTEVYIWGPEEQFVSFQEYADISSQESGHQYTVTITPEEIIDKGYFKDNNLAAWELKYKLDNDQNYEWACKAEETEKLHINVCTSFDGSIDSQGLVGKNSTYQNEEIVLTDANITSDPSWEAYLFETLQYDKTQCKLFNLQEGKTIYCAHLELGTSRIVTSKLVFYDGENRNIYILYDNPSSANMESYYYVEPDEYEDYIGYFTNFDPYIETVKGKNPGKGLIYYMKDEFGNEAPYDFKNFGNLVEGGGGQTKSFSAQADILGDNNEVIQDANVDFEYVDDPLNDSSDPLTKTFGIVRNTKAPKEDEEGEGKDPDYDKIDSTIKNRIFNYISNGYRWFKPTLNGSPVKLVNEANYGSNQVVCDYVLAYVEVSPKENDGDENDGRKIVEKSQKSNSQNRERSKVKFSVAGIKASMHQDDTSNTKGPSSKTTNEIMGFGGFSKDPMILVNGSIVTMAEASIIEENMARLPLSDLYHLPSKKADPTVSPSSDTVYDVVVDDLLLYLYNTNIENPEDVSLNIENTCVTDVKIISTAVMGQYYFPCLIFNIYNSNIKLTNSTFKDISYVTFGITGRCYNNYFNETYHPDEDEYIVNLYSAYGNIFNPGMTLPSTINGIHDREIQNDYTTLQNKPYVVLDNGYSDLDELIANQELVSGTVYDIGGGEFAIATSEYSAYIVQGTQYTPQP